MAGPWSLPGLPSRTTLGGMTAERMTTARRLVRVLFIAALAGAFGFGSAGTPSMAADPVFTVVSASYSASTVTVSGVQTQPLTVTVHVTADPAIHTDNGYLGAGLGRTAGTGSLANTFVWMNLVSGDGNDGVWAGTFAIPSTAAGTWTLGNVLECRFCEPSGPAHPVTGMPTFTVVGTHLPRLSAGQSPNPTPLDASPFTIKGRATDSATGAGIPGVRVGLGYDYGCMPDPVWRFYVRVTNSLGYYGFTIPSQDALQAKQFIRCMAVLGPPQSDGIEQLVLIRGFSVRVQMAPVTRLSDLNRDGFTDLVSRDTAGLLWLYPGNGAGRFLSRRQMGSGWNSMTAIVTPGDVTGDGNADVLARDSLGRLWLYPGNGAGRFLSRRQIGNGWKTMTVITDAADMNGAGRPDVLARDSAGRLWLYPLSGNAVFGTRRLVSSGWSAMTSVLGPGDVSGDGRADVLARDSAGSLWLHRGNGTGGVAARTLASGELQAMTALITPGNWDRADGNDFLARDVAGRLWLNPGDNVGGFGPRRQIGAGWSGMTFIG